MTHDTSTHDIDLYRAWLDALVQARQTTDVALHAELPGAIDITINGVLEKRGACYAVFNSDIGVYFNPDKVTMLTLVDDHVSITIEFSVTQV